MFGQRPDVEINNTESLQHVADLYFNVGIKTNRESLQDVAESYSNVEICNPGPTARSSGTPPWCCSATCRRDICCDKRTRGREVSQSAGCLNVSRNSHGFVYCERTYTHIHTHTPIAKLNRRDRGRRHCGASACWSWAAAWDTWATAWRGWGAT